MSDGLIELLREDARAYARGTQMIAASKGPGYSGLEPEQTTPWRAADRIETLERSLEQISRMRLMPDDKANRITLYAAIEVAKLHFQQKGDGK